METHLDKKFYVPSIEEFFVGFEYEYYYNPIRYKIIDDKIQTWEKKVYKGDDFAGLHKNVGEEWKYDVFAQINGLLYLEDLVRVKYLDTSDIEELGFTVIKTKENAFEAIKKFNFTYEDCTTEGEYNIIVGGDKYCVIKLKDIGETTLFRGEIKNKNVLKQVFKMLDIK